MSLLNRLHVHPLIKKVARVAQAHNVPVYLVGGAVRDALRGIEHAHDFDFVLADGFDEVVACFAREQHGKVIDWDVDQKRIVFRQDNTRITVDFSRMRMPDIINDLEQRDFTVNAMALAVHTPDLQLIDPLGGKDDLTARCLRMCSDVAFEADPLRMLRAVRFARQLACKIEFRTRESMCCNSSLITRSARERIKRELFMILHGPDQEISLRELHDCGLLERLLPDMRLMDSEFQNVAQEHLSLENLLRSLGFLEEVSRITDARFEGVRQQLSDYLNREFEEGVSMMSLLTFAALLSHIVQVGEVVAVKLGARVCLHGNDKSIIKIIQRIARGIGLGRKAQHVLACLVENNMRIQQMAQRESLGERAKVRFVLDCGDVAVGVCLLAIADSLATASQGSNQRVRDIAHDLCKFILVSQDLHEAAPLLTGDDIITSFGLKEGPHVGDVLRQAAQLERDGILQDRKAALIWLHSLSPNG